MNCQEALELLYDIIDKEASEIDTQQVQEHLERCRHCFEVYRLEKSIQDFINEKVSATSSESRAERLRSKIASRLDSIDREQAVPEKKPRFFNLATRTMVAAASLVILVGAGFILSDFYRHQDIYTPFERAHSGIDTEIHTLADPQLTQAQLAVSRERYDCPLAEVVGQFNLLGGHPEVVMGVEMAHFVYHNGTALVSVFVGPADGIELSEELQRSTVGCNNKVFFNHDCQGCRMMFHRTGTATIITASKDRAVNLLQFVPGASAI